MQVIADLHVHSRYSRATSRDLGVAGLYKGAKTKGIDVMATGDFTHPQYVEELQKELVPLDNGLYRYREDRAATVKFFLSQEISSIYKRHDKVRRIHNLVFAPSLEIVGKIIKKLERIGNLAADGRPILGLDSEELLKIILDISEDCMLVPAHVWTPWFSLFGSKSGFDSIEECFGSMSSYIYAVETGLSSDPLMNWRLSQLDHVTIISNGDGHSAANLGREATVFELEEITYQNVTCALKRSAQLDRPHMSGNYVRSTIEFFPEEGKYHWDGHRDCGVQYAPEKTETLKGMCPICNRPLTVGVMHRVSSLADRTADAARVAAQKRPPYKSIVPLAEIIASAIGVGKNSKKVQDIYAKCIAIGSNEFHALLDADAKIFSSVDPKISEGITRVRNGTVFIDPGYDGVYGKVEVFRESERKPATQKLPL